MTADSDRFARAIEKFDAANREDPHKEVVAGIEHPQELLYARRMSARLEKLAPDAAEPLRLAARAQHICRWKIPRADYPAGRSGYLDWRNACKQMHADLAGEVLREIGYEGETIQRVQDLLLKKRLKLDPEMQLLEDVICLVFLENYLAEFATKHDDPKLITIIQKTWKKMSPAGHEAALALDLPANVRALVEKALGG
jgi:hypothetical protein